MRTYIARRLLFNIPVLIIVSLLVFSLVRLAPGDEVVKQLALSGTVNPDLAESIRAELGLDQPAYLQYFEWMGGVLRGDLGRSFFTRDPVAAEIRRSLPVTVQLGVVSLVLGFLIGAISGIVSATRRGTKVDYVARLVAIIGITTPNFFIGLIVIIVLSKWVGYFPPVGYVSFWEDPAKNIEQTFLPILILAFGFSGPIARMVRSMMLEVLTSDYIRTARAKGLTNRAVLLRHALKNAMIPIISIIGAQAGVVIGGTVIMEVLFSLPGMGLLVFRATQNSDYNLVQGIALMIGAFIVTVNLVVDLSYGVLDPRIRYS